MYLVCRLLLERFPHTLYLHSFPTRRSSDLLIFNVYFLAAVATLIFQLTRDLRMLAGSQRSEMAFIMIGAVVTLVSSVPLQLLLKLFGTDEKIGRAHV